MIRDLKTIKYYRLLDRIIDDGFYQANKKGASYYLINERLDMSEAELLHFFSAHPIAKSKLEKELDLYMQGETDIQKYNEAGINWWDYCKPVLINSYPTYFKKLPKLINKINNEKRPSKNYVLFIGETDVQTNQLPCLSLMQFQICQFSNGEEKLFITVYQRSADSNLGLPSDLYQTYLISKMIDVPLGGITFFIGNAHIYENNVELTKQMLSGEKVKFNLNV